MRKREGTRLSLLNPPVKGLRSKRNSEPKTVNKMAAFCTKCHRALGMEGEPDIDVQKIFEEKLVEDDTMLDGFLCEGCTLVAIARIDNSLRVQYIDGDWADYDRPPRKEKKDG